MNTTKLMILTVLVILIIAALSAVGYVLGNRAIRFTAIDACLRTGQAQFTNIAKQNVTVPDTFWYNFCMKEKGLK